MRDVGLHADTAENGRIAVEMAAAAAYDLVLMDVHLPEMDGIEATRRIRLQKGPEVLPILAMTASAFEEDRRACMEAGMDDFVAKPVQPDDLYRTLARWLARRSAARGGVQRQAMVPPPAPIPAPAPAAASAAPLPAASPVPPTAAAPAQESLQQRLVAILGTGSEERVAAMLRYSADKYIAMLARFAAEQCEEVQALDGLLASGRREEARRSAHGVGGVAATLGAAEVKAATLRLEQALRSDAPESVCRGLAASCQEAMDRVGRGVQELQPQDPPAA
jgi:CheY-like chemotaxis protein/HPt (histidine-containing phosphotransfer) domain-containing protein